MHARHGRLAQPTWSSRIPAATNAGACPVARRAHNPKAAGSNPAPATKLTCRINALHHSLGPLACRRRSRVRAMSAKLPPDESAVLANVSSSGILLRSCPALGGTAGFRCRAARTSATMDAASLGLDLPEWGRSVWCSRSSSYKPAF